MKLLFIDIDGVLNDGKFNIVSESMSINPEMVEQLNRIIYKTSCKIVISSAWRYLVLKGSMTLKGFEYLLRTHGVTKDIKIIGTTGFDEEHLAGPCCNRGEQITEYLEDFNTFNPETELESYCVLDDLDLGIREAGHPFVQTDWTVIGLTEEKADEVIKILNRST